MSSIVTLAAIVWTLTIIVGAWSAAREPDREQTRESMRIAYESSNNYQHLARCAFQAMLCARSEAEREEFRHKKEQYEQRAAECLQQANQLAEQL